MILDFAKHCSISDQTLFSASSNDGHVNNEAVPGSSNGSSYGQAASVHHLNRNRASQPKLTRNAPNGQGATSEPLSKFKSSAKRKRLNKGEFDAVATAREVQRMTAKGQQQQQQPTIRSQPSTSTSGQEPLTSFQITSKRLNIPINVAPVQQRQGQPVSAQNPQPPEVVAPAATSTTESLPSGSPLKTPFKSRKARVPTRIDSGNAQVRYQYTYSQQLPEEYRSFNPDTGVLNQSFVYFEGVHV